MKIRKSPKGEDWSFFMKKAKTFTIKGDSIILTKAYAKLAYTPGTKEFRELAALHKAFPDFSIEMRTATPKKEKEKHNGLTIERMAFIIKNYVKDEAAIAEFENVKKFYKGVDGYYGKVKGWFLKKYDNYQELINNATAEPAAQAPASEATTV